MSDMKNGNFLKIQDLVSLNLSEAPLIRDNLVQASSPTMVQTGKGLFVRIAATHAGIVTRNNMLYLPDKMREGAKTFTVPFPKPVLVNHNDEGTAIGRVVGARYVDTTAFVKDKYRGKKLRDSLEVTDTIIDNFCNGKMTYAAQVDFIRTYLKDSILKDPEYQGLGYIELTAHITDPEAIQKFTDGRYLTGSVGAATDRASCSVCKQDWTKDGMCDHRPGKVYDGADCYIIAGNFEYEEFSMVNKPADRHARVMALSYNGAMQDAKVEDAEFSGKLYEVRVTFLKEEDVMKVKDSENTTEKKEEIAPSESVVDQTELSFDDFITRVLDETKGDLTDAEDEKLYGLMLNEMKESKLFEDKQIEDVKLSAEKRKGLAKSTFCGPNKSFPVPDCAHVTAARRLIDRYKGPGDKMEILACVARKISAMGCKEEMADQVVTNDNMAHASVLRSLLSALESSGYMPDDKKPLEEEDLKLLQTLISKMAAMVTKDAFVAALFATDLTKDLNAVADKTMLSEVISLETKLGELRGELKKLTDSSAALKQEYDIAVKEAEVLQDEVVKVKADLRGSKVKNLALYKSLKTGTLVESVEATVTDSVIDSELEVLVKEVDMKKITDKLNDGTSRNPHGTVEDPSGIQDNKAVDAASVRGKLASIEAQYMQLKFQNSIVADAYLKKELDALRVQGLLPKDNE